MTLTDTIRQLLIDRQALARRVADIDRDILAARKTLAAAAVTPLPPAPAARGVATPAPARHRREPERAQCRRDILAFLSTGPKSMARVLANLGRSQLVVREELRELKLQGAVTRTGTLGRNVRWAIAPARDVAVTVWPLPNDPRQPPSALGAASV